MHGYTHTPKREHSFLKASWSIAALLLTLAIAGVSSMPAGTIGGTGSTGEQVVSNILHIPAFALLTFLWIKAFRLEKTGRHPGNKKAILWLLIALVVFGALTEYHQSFIPGRFASIRDFAFNLIGILLGWWSAGKVHGRGRPS